MVGRELDGVRQVVVEDLLEAGGVGHHGGQRRINLHRDVHQLRGRQGAHDIPDLADELRDIDLLRPELDLARFHLGQIQDVVDDLQQVAGAG